VKGQLFCGTVGFGAPEVIKYGKSYYKSDIYSCGLVLYHMLYGEPAFKGPNKANIMEKNEKNVIQFNKSRHSISREAQDFILELTNKSPNLRPTANEALENKWFHKMLQKAGSGYANLLVASTKSTFGSSDNFNNIMSPYEKTTPKILKEISFPKSPDTKLHTPDIKINNLLPTGSVNCLHKFNF